MSQQSAVIVPLYIYPFPGAWDPLHEAVSRHPNLPFVVIINPHNGPGIADPFDANYQREIPKLNACSNVTTIGYVKTNYCKRPLTEVCRDIDVYACWAKDFATSGLAVKGIFFDEIPNLYDANQAAYLSITDQTVKQMVGIQGQRLVVHNPGTVQDAGFASPGPDVTAVFEASFAEYRSNAVQQRISALLRYKPEKCAWFVHSVPIEDMEQLVLELRHRGSYVFATSLCKDFYIRFGPSWKKFVAAMASGDES